MDKKYYIIIGVVIVLWAGFFAYRIHKNKNELTTHHKKTYDRLLARAKIIPQAGLTQMVDALNRYHEKNKSYPASLEMLYPDFMPSQAYIRELEWAYEPKGTNFMLSKTIVRDNERLVASMDNKKMLAMGTSVMVAAKTPGVRVEINTSPSSSVVVKGPAMTVTGSIRMDIPSSTSPLLASGQEMVDISEPEPQQQPALPPPPSEMEEPEVIPGPLGNGGGAARRPGRPGQPVLFGVEG